MVPMSRGIGKSTGVIPVSVVIPTYNRLDRLKRVLAALEQQLFPLEQVEVVVVSDGSTDGTNEYLRTIETVLNVVPVLQSNRGVAAARNQGVARASGETVLFLDDDVMPTPLLVREHMRIHGEQSAVVVLGPMLSPPDFKLSPWVRWEQAMLDKQYSAMTEARWRPTPRQFYTGNASLARRYVIEAGGFDESFRRAEDVELAYRLAPLGLQFVFNADAIGYHYAERSFRSWMDTPYLYGRYDVVFGRDKDQHWLLPQIAKEFRRRNHLIRLLVHFCVGRPTLTRTLLTALKVASDLSQQIWSERLIRAAHSSMYNLRYYQGVAEELGGRAPFYALLR